VLIDRGLIERDATHHDFGHLVVVNALNAEAHVHAHPIETEDY
jgi:hypothetical protein